MISIAVHAVLSGALVWFGAGRTARRASDRSAPDRAPQGVVDGPGALKFALPLGPSLSPAEAAPYLGRYTMASADRSSTELHVTRAKDGEDHWSLSITEGNAASYTLIPIASDSFISQLNQDHRVAFARRDSTVVQIELLWLGGVRRGIKAAGIARD